MTTTAVPLQDLAQRIAQQRSELVALHREHKARSAKLSKLNRRRHELETHLRKVEKEINAIAQGDSMKPTATGRGLPTSSVKSSSSMATQAVVKTHSPVSQPAAGQPTLAQLIVNILAEAKGQPLTVKQLTQVAQRRGLESSSSDPTKLIGTRVSDLLRRGLLKRLPDHAGVTLADKGNGKSSSSPSKHAGKKKAAGAVKATKNGKHVPSTAKSSGASSTQPKSLHEAMIGCLQKSNRPLRARELAEQILKNGYKTESKDFVNVVSAAFAKFNDMERAPEGGYRLKKKSK